MSAKGRKRLDAPATEVAAFEFYPTPPDAIVPLLETPLLSLPGGHWIDPCVGSARIPSTVNAHRSDVTWTLCEIDERHRLAITVAMAPRSYVLLPFGDFVIREWTTERADVLIMNPPFSHALDFVRAAFDRAGWVIMLQRIAWMCPARASWLRKHAPDVYSLPKRPSFTGDGKTDMADYAWFVWPPGDRERRWGRVAMLDAPSAQGDLFGATP